MARKHFLRLFALLLIIAVLWGLCACKNEELDPGRGVEEFHITSIDELAGIRGYGTYILDNDLDFEGQDFATLPFFGGVLEGNGHVLRNVCFVSNKDMCGLFGNLSSAEIRNLGIENFSIRLTEATEEADDLYIGALAGYVNGYQTRITNCYSTGNILLPSWEKDISAGGLVGAADCLTMQNCYSTASLSLSDTESSAENNTIAIGGLAGRIKHPSITIQHSYFAGSIVHQTSAMLMPFRRTDIGGIVGNCISGRILGCVSIPGELSSQAPDSHNIGIGPIVGQVSKGEFYANYYCAYQQDADTPLSEEQAEVMLSRFPQNLDTTVGTPIHAPKYELTSQKFLTADDYRRINRYGEEEAVYTEFDPTVWQFPASDEAHFLLPTLICFSQGEST